MNTVESLKQLYVKMGGNLSDSYPEIASGIPVSDYVLIPDCISALNKVAGSSSGGDGVLVIHESEADNYTGEGTKYVLDVTTEELLAAVNAGKIIVYAVKGV